MAKKEKIIDLKAKPKTVTEEHLKSLQDVVSSINRSQMDVGKLESQKHHMLHEIAGLHEKLNEIQSTMKEEYGTLDIDINDGTINYPEEDVKTD